MAVFWQQRWDKNLACAFTRQPIGVWSQRTQIMVMTATEQTLTRKVGWSPRLTMGLFGSMAATSTFLRKNRRAVARDQSRSASRQTAGRSPWASQILRRLPCSLATISPLSSARTQVASIAGISWLSLGLLMASSCSRAERGRRSGAGLMVDAALIQTFQPGLIIPFSPRFGCRMVGLHSARMIRPGALLILVVSAHS